MRLAVLRRIASTVLREFVRTPEAVFWTYGFPVLMAVVLGLAFGGSGAEKGRVVIVEGASAPAFAAALGEQPLLEFEVRDAAAADDSLVRGRAVVAISGAADAPRLTYDPGNPAADRTRRLVEDALQRHAGRTDPIAVEVHEEHQPGRRYIDFLIPGLIGLNVLGAGLWGVGFTLVDYRVKRLLRRLVVTPMLRSEFLLAYLLSRLGLVLFDAVIIALFGVLCFGVPVRGSIPLLLAIVLLGGVAFSGLGLLVGSRARSIEAVSGLMNLVMLPMWLLGGSFFSNENFGFLQPLVDVLPLTYLNAALREVLLYGGGIGAVAGECAFLALFGAGCFAVALRVFRWS